MELNRKIRYIRTYDYCDGPQSFLAADQLDTKYFCILVDIQNDSKRYVCTPISSNRLSEFHEGKYDIRRLFEEDETGELFYFDDINDSDSIQLKPVTNNEIPEDWLPDEGLLFLGTTADNAILREVAERNTAIIRLSLNPPESQNDSKINAMHLSEALVLFQNLVKHSYKKAIQHNRNRVVFDKPEYYEMEIFATSPGSFTLHMQSTTPADLVGFSPIGRSLLNIDDLLQANDEPTLIEVLRKNKGHVVKIYRKLLEYIINQKTSIFYEWSMPAMKSTVQRRITQDDARPIFDLLNKKQELTIEEKEFIGKVMKVDVINGKWSILSEEDGKLYSGEIRDKDVHLGGITTETKRYRFTCSEIIEEESISGRELIYLYLNSYNEVP
jgi:hypothetical protein